LVEPQGGLTELWTVDVWTVMPGSNDDFLKLLREHTVGGDRIFLDADRPRTYWFPRRWESRDQMEKWHSEFSEKAAPMVSQSATHIMRLVHDE
jgi:hypothetical protein